MPEFNLLDEPFIPVTTLGGARSEVGLIALFNQLVDIRDIGGDLPTQKFALFRLLLAILHDAVDISNEDQWVDLWETGVPDDRVITYLNSFRDRFWLIHPERPFMQVAELRSGKGTWSGVDMIVADVDRGPFLAMRSGDGLRDLSFAEAARWLIHVHAFDPSGIRTGAVGDPQVKGGRGYPIGPAWAGRLGGLILHGGNIERTLLLNAVPRDETAWSGEADRPVWARDNADGPVRDSWEDRVAPGQVALLAWQSRRVRLVSRDRRVVGVVLAQGDKMTPQNRHRVEPMTGWRYSTPQSKKRGQATYMPRKHDPARALWRNLPAIVEPSGLVDGQQAALSPLTVRWVRGHADVVGRFGRLRLESVGMEYGAQEATVDELVHDELDLSVSLLDERAAPVRAVVSDAIASTQGAASCLGRLAANLATAAGERGDQAGAGARDQSTASVFASLDQPCRNWITNLTDQSDPQRALAEWQRTALNIVMDHAQDLLDHASPAAVIGREVGGRFLNAARAESFFRSRLREELPHAAASEPPQRTPSSGGTT